MKLTMLGTGNAMVTQCYNTCFVLEEDDRYFMVDAGGGNTIMMRMKEAGIDWKNVRDIFVTHKHIDHILGVVWMMRLICQNMKRGNYTGSARIYAHREVAEILQNLADTLLQKNQSAYIRMQTLKEYEAAHRKDTGKKAAKTSEKKENTAGKPQAAEHADESQEMVLHLIIVEDGEETEVLGHPVTFFDIHSTKAKQFGFSMEIRSGEILTCCGDEPYNDLEEPYAKGSRWLMHEAFCLYGQADIFKPYEKHHSTARDAAELAEKLGVKNLILYHTEDKNIKNRKELYTAEGKQCFSGKLYVPEDLETIQL